MGSIEKTVCVVCDGGSVSPVTAQPLDYEYFVRPERELNIYHCGDCGSRFIHPRPSVEELISFYPPDYHAYNEDHGGVAKSLVDLRAKARAKSLLELAGGKTPARLFDVGTGDCRHFADMSKHGEFEFAGVEINPGMVESARKRGYRVEQGTLEELDITPHVGKYDVVTMYQLVEHVLNPKLLFEKALALLRPGGSVVGQLPCMDSFDRRVFGRYWAGYHYPRHLQMFTRRGLGLLLDRAGFGEISLKSAAHLQAGLSLQNFIVGGLGWHPKMTFGKTPVYSILLLGVIPFCAFEHLCGRGGMMDFHARKQADQT